MSGGIELPTNWEDDNPFYLLIASPTGHVIVDLGTKGWVAMYNDWMRKPANWHLVAKGNNRILLSVKVHEGDQPYYTARHVGSAGSGGSNEVTCYGIGKKQVNGETVRLWILPNGTVVGGDDVEPFGIDILRAVGPR